MVGQLFQDHTTGQWQNGEFRLRKLGLRAKFLTTQLHGLSATWTEHDHLLPCLKQQLSLET